MKNIATGLTTNSIMPASLRLGTRSSRLALAQAEIVRHHLAGLGVACEVVELSTLGDKDPSTPISQLPSAAAFVDDIESALLNNDIDIAVHSLKDMPLLPTQGLHIAAILERGDPRESLVSAHGETFDELPHGAVIGTSCARRAAQIRYLRSDLRAASIRGPVDDRIRQVREGRFDAAILAIAGLDRAHLVDEASEVFALGRFVPAPAQAALAIQTRANDIETRACVARLDHSATRDCVTAELAILAHFGDRTDITIAAVAESTMPMRLRVRVLSVDGRPLYESIFAGVDAAGIARHAIHRIGDVIQTRKAAV